MVGAPPRAKCSSLIAVAPYLPGCGVFGQVAGLGAWGGSITTVGGFGNLEPGIKVNHITATEDVHPQVSRGGVRVGQVVYASTKNMRA